MKPHSDCKSNWARLRYWWPVWVPTLAVGAFLVAVVVEVTNR